MTKTTIIKTIGTVLAFVAGAGSVFIPEPYRAAVVGFAGGVLGWLHLPQPGTQPVSK
jgi:hypothetical protein